MTISKLILDLQKIKKEHGNIDCEISIDTSDAFNVTKLLDVIINRYEATDTPDGYVYSVCLHGELIPEPEED